MRVMGWTTRRPFARHQRSRALFLEGTRIPGPAKDSAEAMRAWRSMFVSAVEWPKKARCVVYPVMRPSRSTTRAVPCSIACARSIPRSNPWTRCDRALQAFTSSGLAGRTVQPGMVRWSGLSLQAGERFADVEAEGGVEGERAIVEGGLDQTDSGGALLVRAVHRGLHELTTDAEVLYVGVDGDGANASNQGTLIEAVAADDPAVVFGDDAIEAGAREHHGEQADGSLRVRGDRRENRGLR